MRTLLGWVCLVAGLTWAAGGFATAADKNRGDNEKRPLSDQQFVDKAAAGGMFEVESSRFASEQGHSDAVKRFAKHMIDDHTKANQELIGLATQKGWIVPKGVTEHQAQVLAKLGKLNGAQFDAQYAKVQVEAHQKTIALFERESQDGKDADLKAWAKKTLPTLRDHLKMAQDLARSSNNPSEGGKGGKDTDR